MLVLMKGLLLSLVCVAAGLWPAFGRTDPRDAAALRSLMSHWKNTPPTWGRTDDPCGTRWEGVSCSSSRVTTLKLFSMGLEGTLSPDIRNLTELRTLDLSYNPKLGPTLTPAVGDLKLLETLVITGCNFSGSIPDELGNLSHLTFLALNSNRFTGKIPASLGMLSNLSWLDLGDNQLTGSLPVSTDDTPGLNQLLKAKHFHLNKNQFSGPIPENLFNSDMSIIHVLLDRNKLTGTIPESIGLVNKLEILRLDNNFLSGPVPSNITNLKELTVLHLANNSLNESMPDLTGMNKLTYVDLSNNSFDPSEAPPWFSSLQNLTTLVIESGRLHGEVPQKLFGLPQLQEVRLKNNAFKGTLDLDNNSSPKLEIVDFQNNDLDLVRLSSNFKAGIILVGNPVCSSISLVFTPYCQPQQEPDSYPKQVNCSHPYGGRMIFRAPFFRDMEHYRPALEDSIRDKLNHAPVYFFLPSSFSYHGSPYLWVLLQFCPLTDTYFNRTGILSWLDLSSKSYGAPEVFGPHYFEATSYPFPNQAKLNRRGLIIGLAIACTLMFLGLVGFGIYALQQKKRAQREIALTNPFASWESTGEDGGAPQLKAPKCFTFDELRKYTNNFPDVNVIGRGGYGKVYRGTIPDGQIVAIKRLQQGSTQGGLEFKTEIELLSRVHHRNLVGLVGFCFEKGEQMLVYEFISNGALRECLSGKSGIQLDWKRRLRIALDSARGLSYLHELANPPIIHRDVKSTNILLDENLTAKVADFGISTLVSDSEAAFVSTHVKGTPGYLDPEYYMTHQLTVKSDVYSFGVVMMELVSARSPIQNGNYIVREVKMAINENDKEYYGLKEIMDPVIKNTGYLTGFQRFVDLAVQCVQDSAVHRPTMSDVVKEIETILHNDGRMTSGALWYSYGDLLPTRNDASSSMSSDAFVCAFDYSGGCSLSARPQPK